MVNKAKKWISSYTNIYCDKYAKNNSLCKKS